MEPLLVALFIALMLTAAWSWLRLERLHAEIRKSLLLDQHPVHPPVR